MEQNRDNYQMFATKARGNLVFWVKMEDYVPLIYKDNLTGWMMILVLLLFSNNHMFLFKSTCCLFLFSYALLLHLILKDQLLWTGLGPKKKKKK